MTSTTSTNDTGNSPGELYIVATPIGNLDDITLRAIETLNKVDEIICEDTRHSQRLLTHLNINKKLISLHSFNESYKSTLLLEKLIQGKKLGLISDAGTPLISDPGFPLVQLAQEHSIPVIPIPGACALITALQASGMPANKFSFEGFLPAKSKARLTALSLIQNEERTVVFYESPHRILESLADIKQVFGFDRHCVIAKELTKSFENFITGSIEDVETTLAETPELQKGEFVILIAGEKKRSTDDEKIRKLLKIFLDEGISLKSAAALASKITNCKKNHAYQLALKL